MCRCTSLEPIGKSEIYKMLNEGLKELNVEDVDIYVKELDVGVSRAMAKEGYHLNARVYGENGRYIIEVGGMTEWRLPYVICHELIHIKQIETGDLKLIREENRVMYKGRLYRDVRNLKYEDRLWEIEADIEGRRLRKRLIEKGIWK